MTPCQTAELSASSLFILTNDTINWGVDGRNSPASAGANPLLGWASLHLSLAWDCHSSVTQFVFLSPTPCLSVHLHPASWLVQIQPQKAVLKLGVSFELCNKPVIPSTSELVVFPLQEEGFL